MANSCAAAGRCAPHQNPIKLHTLLLTRRYVEFTDRLQIFEHLLALIKQYFHIALRTPWMFLLFLFQALWPIGKILENRTKKFNIFLFYFIFSSTLVSNGGNYFLWIILRGLLIKIRSLYPSEDDLTIVKLFFGLAGGRDRWRAGRRWRRGGNMTVEGQKGHMHK